MELKLKWTSHSVLFVNGNDNDDANSNNIGFNIKGTKLYDTLSKKVNHKLSNRLRKDQYIGINIKQRVRIKMQ